MKIRIPFLNRQQVSRKIKEKCRPKTIDLLQKRPSVRSNRYYGYKPKPPPPTLENLDEGCLLKIMGFLSPNEVDQMNGVCKRIHSIVKKNNKILPLHDIADLQIHRCLDGTVSIEGRRETNVLPLRIQSTFLHLRYYFARIKVERLLLLGKVCNFMLNMLCRITIERVVVKKAVMVARPELFSSFVRISGVVLLHLVQCRFENAYFVTDQTLIENPQLRFPRLTDRSLEVLAANGKLPEMLILENIETGISINGIRTVFDTFDVSPPSRPIFYALDRIGSHRSRCLKLLGEMPNLTIVQNRSTRIRVESIYKPEVAVCFTAKIPKTRLEIRD
ncbi:unnamed protein product, partial [Mesorhabditis spiculigera]